MSAASNVSGKPPCSNRWSSSGALKGSPHSSHSTGHRWMECLRPASESRNFRVAARVEEPVARILQMGIFIGGDLQQPAWVFQMMHFVKHQNWTPATDLRKTVPDPQASESSRAGRSSCTPSRANIRAIVVLPTRRTPESQTIERLFQVSWICVNQNGRSIMSTNYAFSRLNVKYDSD